MKKNLTVTTYYLIALAIVGLGIQRVNQINSDTVELFQKQSCIENNSSTTCGSSYRSDIISSATKMTCSDECHSSEASSNNSCCGDNHCGNSIPLVAFSLMLQSNQWFASPQTNKRVIPLSEFWEGGVSSTLLRPPQA